MTKGSFSNLPENPPAIGNRPEEDLTGQDRLVSNVLYSWGGYFVVFVAGFILPRMIDRSIGQVALGIWDFSWSFVNYMSLAMLGIGSSVNRYVAMFRAGRDDEGLCTAVSSVVFIQIVIAGVVTLGVMALVFSMPYLFAEKLGKEMNTAQEVVFLLGMSLAVQMAFDAFRGVMTGCHRWDLYNLLNAVSRGVEVVAMILALWLGGGLVALGYVYLSIMVITECARMAISFRICPELKIERKYVRWRQMKKMFLFGFKTIVADLPPLVIVQTTNLMVAAHLGPAALAVFARPVALVRHAETFMNKFAYILTPTASALQEIGKKSELQDFLIKTTRFSVAMALPMYLALGIYGDLILELWMGPGYSVLTLISVLSAGYFIVISQNSILRILVGLNQHGKVGLLSLAASIGSFIIGIVLVHYIGWSLEKAAIVVAASLSIGKGVIIPVYACMKLEVPFIYYVYHSLFKPIVYGGCFAAFLLIIRIIFDGQLYTTLSFGLLLGGSLLLILYWHYLLDKNIKKKIRFYLRRYK